MVQFLFSNEHLPHLIDPLLSILLFLSTQVSCSSFFEQLLSSGGEAMVSLSGLSFSSLEAQSTYKIKTRSKEMMLFLIQYQSSNSNNVKLMHCHMCSWMTNELNQLTNIILKLHVYILLYDKQWEYQTVNNWDIFYM